MKPKTFATLTLVAISAGVATLASALTPFDPTSFVSATAIATAPTAAATAISTVDEPTQIAQAAGRFVPVDHAVSGSALLETVEGETYLVFDDAFTTDDGPDLVVILYKEATVPLAIAEDDYITLAPLASPSGSQRYRIPADIDLADYQSVSIWCRAFNVTFSYAPLH
ncbi:DM13 domain-containing protein [Leptolyngbya sp. PCC 6406]|uniref:DM13 domain-containing protein n=1 Tax=Leptolyngbya sp. PCC 6406 TaxID=1173264 RepID=UPI0002ABC233|nr:DM13 domain-containing protein [Leptolyngbya sp. PCC 6406]